MLKTYLKERGARPGKLFEGLTYANLNCMVMMLFHQANIKEKQAMLSPHSLRHTAGQLLYDRGIPLEFIQKTLRHTILESTLVYAQKAIERSM